MSELIPGPGLAKGLFCISNVPTKSQTPICEYEAWKNCIAVEWINEPSASGPPDHCEVQSQAIGSIELERLFNVCDLHNLYVYGTAPLSRCQKAFCLRWGPARHTSYIYGLGTGTSMSVLLLFTEVIFTRHALRLQTPRHLLIQPSWTS